MTGFHRQLLGEASGLSLFLLIDEGGIFVIIHRSTSQL